VLTLTACLVNAGDFGRSGRNLRRTRPRKAARYPSLGCCGALESRAEWPTLEKQGCGVRQGTFDPGAYNYRMGAVPDRARGLGYMVPTYTCRDHAGSTAQRLTRLCTPPGAGYRAARQDDRMTIPGLPAPDDEQAIVLAKSALRADMKARRTGLGPGERAQGARQIAALDLEALLGLHGQTISLFRSMGEELDTQPLLDRLCQLGYRTCLPVMQGRGKPLIFRAWKPGDPLATAIWGIEEPTADCPEVEPDVLLLPLLAFDRAGWRLGYGGGFFDRTLRQLRTRKPVRAIGLAFPSQEVDAVPHLDYDERIEAVLTPDGLIRCGVEQPADDASTFSR
jgi:5-formyltetrahydrofolate cyclo-ligase